MGEFYPRPMQTFCSSFKVVQMFWFIIISTNILVILDLEIALEMPKSSLMRFNLFNESLIDNMFKLEGGGEHREIDHIVISVIKCTEICHWEDTYES